MTYKSRIGYFNVNDELIMAISLEFVRRDANYNKMNYNKMKRANLPLKEDQYTIIRLKLFVGKIEAIDRKPRATKFESRL